MTSFIAVLITLIDVQFTIGAIETRRTVTSIVECILRDLYTSSRDNLQAVIVLPFLFLLLLLLLSSPEKSVSLMVIIGTAAAGGIVVLLVLAIIVLTLSLIRRRMRFYRGEQVQ